MASSLSLLVLFSSLLLCCYCVIIAEGGVHNNGVVRMASLMPKRVCSTPRGSKSLNTSLTLAHRHGPCSPIAGGKKPTLREILERDQDRVNYLKHKNSKGPQAAAQLQDSEETLPVVKYSGGYLITVGIGTPAVDQTVLIDTGSDIPWIQCKQCSQCYRQNQPSYDPSQSSSFNTIACDSPVCNSGEEHTCAKSSCVYRAGYGGGSVSVGVLSHEKLTIQSSNTFLDFVFGCGLDNEGFDGFAGLFGLGRDPLSLVTQTSQVFGKVFSYCLPRTTSSTGFLNLGDTGNAASGAVSYTPMLTDNTRPSLYSVRLTGISVEGTMLSIPPSTLSSLPTIIDSGTTITQLPPSAYDTLKKAFTSYMTAYPEVPSPVAVLDTCFDFSSSDEIKIPAIALHFEGDATMDLDVSGTIYPVSQTVGCLPFATDNELSIIGNVQQRTFEVIYNIPAAKIGFRPGACS